MPPACMVLPAEPVLWRHSRASRHRARLHGWCLSTPITFFSSENEPLVARPTGTINLNVVNAKGDISSVTTTSGLAWKIPGRAGDSPIIGAGQYTDNDVGAAGSTGRGEANLYNLTSYLIVENMRRGMSPKDAGMDGLRRIQKNTVEKRLLNSR